MFPLVVVLVLMIELSLLVRISSDVGKEVVAKKVRVIPLRCGIIMKRLV